MFRPCDPRSRCRGSSLAVLASAVLLATVLLSTGPTLAQQASSEELARLEQMAEQSFIADELGTAAELYSQLAGRLTDPAEKASKLMTVAWIELLRGLDQATIDRLVQALLVDPDLVFQPDLYNTRFRDLFYDAQRRAEEERNHLTSLRVREGTAQLRNKDYAAARQSFEEALALRPNHVNGLYNLALTEVYAGRSEEALTGFQKLLALGDAVPPGTRALALINVGFLYTRQGSHADAAQALDQAVALRPDHAEAWTNLGVARRELGDAAGAAAAFRRAHELDPESSLTTDNLAMAAIDAQDWSTAVSLLSNATARHPADGSLWLNLGKAQLGLGDGQSAQRSLLQAIAQDPEDRRGVASEASVQLARQAWEARQYQRAFEAARRALGWRDGLVNGWIYQGLAQKGLGDLRGAVTSFERARELDPTRAEIFTNLGSVQELLGRRSEARQAYEQALTLDPANAEARQNLGRLGSGTGTGIGTGTGTVASSPPPPRSTRVGPPPTTPPPPRVVAQTPPPSPPPRQQTPSRPTSGPNLGVRFADIDYSALGLQGAMVELVELGSPAARAGLQKNDLILRIDGRDVGNVDILRQYIASRPRGAVVVLDFLRASKPRRVEVELR